MNLSSLTNCAILGILVSIAAGLLKSNGYGHIKSSKSIVIGNFGLDSSQFHKTYNSSSAFVSGKSKRQEVHDGFGSGRQIVAQVNVNGQLLSFTNLFALWLQLLRRICAWKNYLGLFCAAETSTNTTSASSPRYIVGTQKLRWMEAHLYCKQMGYELTTIESQAEWDLLLNLISNSGLPYGEGFWTSGNDVQREGFFSWLSTGNPIATWYPVVNPPTGQPDNCCGGEDCVVIWPTTLNNAPQHIMNDLDCEAEVYFICKQG